MAMIIDFLAGYSCEAAKSAASIQVIIDFILQKQLCKKSSNSSGGKHDATRSSLSYLEVADYRCRPSCSYWCLDIAAVAAAAAAAACCLLLLLRLLPLLPLLLLVFVTTATAATAAVVVAAVTVDSPIAAVAVIVDVAVVFWGANSDVCVCWVWY